MSKVLFNRSDPKVIATAKECVAVEDFVAIYKDVTTATEKILTQAYYELKYGKIAAIRMTSGSTSNNDPIEPIISHTKKIENMTEEEAKPKRLETHEGEQVLVPAEHVEVLEPLAIANAKAVAAANKKGGNLEKVNKSSKKPVEKSTKQDKIKELLLNGATNKEIKTLLAEEGLKVYDSEILNAKSKLPKQEVKEG